MKRRFHLLTLVTLLGVADVALAWGKGGSSGPVSVRGYVRKDGTYVAPHVRSAPDGVFQNNWSTKGNYNPYTGEEGKVSTPPPLSGAPSLTNNSPAVAPTTSFIGSESKYGADTFDKVGDSSRGSVELLESKPPPSLSARPKPLQPVVSYAKPVNAHTPPAASGRTLSYVEQQKLRDEERALYWQRQGYSFNPAYMTAYSMDQKVKDIERAKYWASHGHSFNADYMTAYSMDQKVKDIERARYWSTRGLSFDPTYMTAYSMDREAERRGVSSR